MPCEEALVFDVEEVNKSVTNSFVMLQSVNQANYDSMKSKYGLEIPEYFTGSYSDFKEKRNELSKLFIEAGYSDIQKNSYRRTISAAAAQAYAICIASNSNKPISAWIEAYSDEQIVVSARCGLKGNQSINYDVIGQTPIKPPTMLSAGSTEALVFDYDKKKDFLVVLNAIDPRTKAADSTVIKFEALKNFTVETKQIEVLGTCMCAAGGRGKTYLSLQTEPAIFIAEQGYYFLYDTRRVVNIEQVPGKGIEHVEIDWIKDNDGSDNPINLKRIIAQPVKVNGNDPDTQGKAYIHCAITAERKYLKEIA